MTRNRFAILLLAVLTAMLLAGCGNETTVDSSAPEGLETFGTAINPSAAPSQAQTIQTTPGDATVKDPTGNGTVTEGDNQGQNSGTVIGDGPAETAAPATQKPSSGGSSSGGSSTSNSTDAPAISPPAPASSATPDEVKEYVGKPVSDLIDDLGYPFRSDYELIDEDDPDSGEIGTLYFDGFTVSTKRTADGEIVTAVNEEDPEPSPAEE